MPCNRIIEGQKVSQYGCIPIPLRLILVKMRRYFRIYPWGMQLGLFFLMIMTMFGFVSFMLLKFLPIVSPFTLTQIEKINESSSGQLVATALTVQGILSAFIFLVPAWVYAYLAHPEPKEYLGLKKPGKNLHLLLSILLMLGALPVLEALQNLISQIDFGAKVKEAQAVNKSMYSAFLNLPTFGAFARAFLVLAIIPAVGEELFFRGILLRFARQKSRTIAIPIIFTAVIFAYTHANIYGLLSIMLAGVLLAVIYYLTGSLWCSILAHMCFNGLQVVLSYLSNSSAAIKTFLNSDSTSWYFVISGVVLFSVSLYLLLKNKTPLADGWAHDFRPGEPRDEWNIVQKDDN